MLEIKKIAILGTGLMAHAIVQEFAQNGYEVHMIGRSDASNNRALKNIETNLTNLKDKGLINEEDIKAASNNIYTHLRIEEMPNDVDLVIESVLEDLDLKRDLFKKIESLCSEKTILASNTSSFPPSQIAKDLKNPERFLNTHYFNPAYLVPLVELVKTEKTEDKYIEIVFDLYTKIGKNPVILKKEFPGFVANRLQIAMLREALHIVQSGVATAQDVDTVIKSSIGRRWAVAGVFEVCELAGLDLFSKIAKELLPTMDSSTEVSPLAIEKVKAGELGAKTGKGFYEWTPESIVALKKKIADHLIAMNS
ncbi:MAG: 3-hydroxyacyl-CoA dehydrogenase family protein [bacterium]|nr:3-hydroxyacyl-CoA dehydrogenase family protein [bacterium]